MKNGQIYTLEKSVPWASTVVISGNKIVEVMADDSEA
jgi:predicted amidohydrolase YtcJ